MTDVALVVAFGFVGGCCAGLFGVSGAVLFVPALSLGLGLSQLHAQATSLAAMIPADADRLQLARRRCSRRLRGAGAVR